MSALRPPLTFDAASRPSVLSLVRPGREAARFEATGRVRAAGADVLAEYRRREQGVDERAWVDGHGAVVLFDIDRAG